MPDTANFILPHTDGAVCSATNDDYPGVTCPVSSGIARLTVDPDLFTDNHTGNYWCCSSETCASSSIATIYGELSCRVIGHFIKRKCMYGIIISCLSYRHWSVAML